MAVYQIIAALYLYVISSVVVWRLISFFIHENLHTVVHLALHLENVNEFISWQ